MMNMLHYLLVLSSSLLHKIFFFFKEMLSSHYVFLAFCVNCITGLNTTTDDIRVLPVKKKS